MRVTHIQGLAPLVALLLAWAAFSAFQGMVLPAAAAGLLLLGYALILSRNAGHARPEPWATTALWAAVAVALIGAALIHPIPAEAPIALLPFVGAAAGVSVGVAQPLATRSWAAASVGLYALVALAYGAPDRFQDQPLESWFYDYNSMATVMGMGVFALLAVALGTQDRRVCGLALVGATALVAGCLWSASRAGVGVLAVSFLALGLTQRAKLLGFFKSRPWAVLPTLAVPLVCLAVLGEKLLGRLQSLGHDESFSGRLDMWRAGLDMIQSAPSALFGYGFLRWEFIYPAFRRAGDFESSGTHAHGDYFELAATGGAAGGLLALLLLGLALTALWRNRAHPALTALSMAPLLLLTHAVVNFPLQNPALTVPMGLLLGLALAPHAPLSLRAKASFGALLARSRIGGVGAALVIATSVPAVTLLALEWTVQAAAFQPGSFAANHLPELGKLGAIERIYGPSAERALGPAPASALATHYTMLAFGDTQAPTAVRVERLEKAKALLRLAPSRFSDERAGALAYLDARGIEAGLNPGMREYSQVLKDLRAAAARRPGDAQLPLRIAQIQGMAQGHDAEREALNQLISHSRLKLVKDRAALRLAQMERFGSGSGTP